MDSAGRTGDAAGPLLVIIGGAPGSGKTTLARRLGAALGLPVLTKDDLKEVLYETVGAPDQARSRQLGHAANVLLVTVAERLVEAGVGIAIESNFYHGFAESQFAPLVHRRRAVLVHCEGEAETIVRRYRERTERGERHPGHHDATVAGVTEIIPRLRGQLADGTFEPLALDVPTIRVDTTTDQEYKPSFAEIVDRIRSAWT